MNTPSPPKLYGEPSKRGEAVRFPPSRNQFQYLGGVFKHARLFEGKKMHLSRETYGSEP